jgi:hypothetical protein
MSMLALSLMYVGIAMINIIPARKTSAFIHFNRATIPQGP